jgi:NADPH-dependent 2,4-dienoyl-CoA reductase/sulfur reductase-like enzyme
LRGRGARVLAIVEQAPLARIRHFLTQYPRKLPYALLLRARLFGIPFHTGTWPVRFQPGRVTLSSGEELAADWLACGFGLVPNTEIAQLLGCRLDDGYVAISGGQQTSVEGVYCAGEPTGIGGLDKAIEEGERAGRSATGQSYRRRRTRSGAFVRDLATAYHLDGRLLALATGDTVVCRCEEVSYSTLAPYREWREAKLLTRCGMGACQGRICGPITNRLFGWTPGSVRPPLVPVSASLLLQQGKADSDHHDRDGGQ